MKQIFELKHKNDKDILPEQIMKDNVQTLEILCKKANEQGFQVTLISPEKYENPKNVYELSAMLAEDLVMKFSENNEILRTK